MKPKEKKKKKSKYSKRYIACDFQWVRCTSTVHGARRRRKKNEWKKLTRDNKIDSTMRLVRVRCSFMVAARDKDARARCGVCQLDLWYQTSANNLYNSRIFAPTEKKEWQTRNNTLALNLKQKSHRVVALFSHLLRILSGATHGLLPIENEREMLNYLKLKAKRMPKTTEKKRKRKKEKRNSLQQQQQQQQLRLPRTLTATALPFVGFFSSAYTRTCTMHRERKKMEERIYKCVL